MKLQEKVYASTPESPGVYLMKNEAGEILYIGKAANLRRRVSSYFLRPHDRRIESLVSKITRIDYEKTDSALEALMLEAKLIKTHAPPFNIREKDDKSFLYIEITDEAFPRVLLVRGKEKSSLGKVKRFGPFVSGGSVREALRLLRRIFPFSTHPPEKIGKFTKPCFEYELGLCPGTCVGEIKKEEYRASIKNLARFLNGEKKAVVRDLEKKMKMLSKELEFEAASKTRAQIFSLKHIQDIAFIGDDELRLPASRNIRHRIEGYDISNISGTFAVGAMVVFSDEESIKSDYRKFKIRTITSANDTGMLREVLLRRFRRGVQTGGWPIPDLILIDGGKGQVSVAHEALEESSLDIPIVGIAKGPTRKKNEFFGVIPQWVSENTLIKVRNEAHRFAISYHRKLRSRFK